MPYDDVFLADQHLLNEEADNALPLLDVEGIGRGAQAAQEAGEGLCEAQIDGAVIYLIEDRLQLRLQSAFALS